MIAGLKAGPPISGEPGVLVLRVGAGWQLEALDGQGGRRTLVVAVPQSDAERQELAILARSLTRPVRVAPVVAPVVTPVVTPVVPKPTPKLAAPPPPPPPPPPVEVVAPVVITPPASPEPNGLRLSVLSGARLGGAGPAAAFRGGLLVGAGWVGVGPYFSGSLPGALGEAADGRAVSTLGGGLRFGTRGGGALPQVLLGLGGERRNFRLDGAPISQVWVPRVELGAAAGWGRRGDRLLVMEPWVGVDLRRVTVQIGESTPERLGRFSAGLGLGVRLDGRRR